ncbi:MAG: zinc-ribbon domain containing protein [Chloroflexota bacterium]
MDKTLSCRDCGCEFVFTSGEQEFYSSHGLMHEPTRCPTCRSTRRAQRNAEGGESYSPRQAPREMHPAVCAECGVETMVPFVPRNDKPVYCSTCFDKVRAAR